MLNELRLLDLATVLGKLPRVNVSRDPADNILLAMAVVGKADYLVSGDRKGVLALGRYKQTKIVTVRRMLKVLLLPQKPYTAGMVETARGPIPTSALGV